MYEKFVALCHAIYGWFKDSWFFGASQELAAGYILFQLIKRGKAIDTMVLNAFASVMEIINSIKNLKDKKDDTTGEADNLEEVDNNK